MMQTQAPMSHAPMAQQLQRFGRGDDTMLVHMTPNEVNSLQGLAMAHGGSLTINPHTGLPEAGWLGKLLPTILGVLGAAVGIPTWAIGLGGAAIGTAVTGDLSKGLMAGLGAYGGAGMASAAGLGGAISKNAFGVLGNGASNAATSAAASAGAGAGNAAVSNAAPMLEQGIHSMDYSGLGKLAAMQPSAAASTAPALGIGQGIQNMTGAGQALASGAVNAGAGLSGAVASPAMEPMGFLDKYKAATNIAGTGNLGAIAGGVGVLNNISEASKPNLDTYKADENKWNYEGPYVPTPRTYVAPTTSAKEREGAEHMWFDNANPVPGYEPYKGTTASPTTSNGSVIDALRYRPQDDVNQNRYADGGQVQSPVAQQVPLARRMERDYGFRPLGGASNPGRAQAMSSLFSGPNGDRISQFLTMKGRGRQGGQQAPAPQPSPALARVAPTASPTPGGERDFGFRPQPVGGPALVNIDDTFNIGAPAAPAVPAIPPSPAASANYAPAPTPTMSSAPMAMPVNSVPVSRFGLTNFGASNGMATMPSQGFARGGEVQLSDGAFVLDARTVSEIGNGSSSAGIEALRRMGGQPVQGPGDGVSDDVPARIGRNQPARVARDEVVMPANVVAKIGKGSTKRGADKLYALMNKAHKARKNAKRGQDTGLRRGLA